MPPETEAHAPDALEHGSPSPDFLDPAVVLAPDLRLVPVPVLRPDAREHRRMLWLQVAVREDTRARAQCVGVDVADVAPQPEPQLAVAEAEGRVEDGRNDRVEERRPRGKAQGRVGRRERRHEGEGAGGVADVEGEVGGGMEVDVDGVVVAPQQLWCCQLESDSTGETARLVGIDVLVVEPVRVRRCQSFVRQVGGDGTRGPLNILIGNEEL